MVEAQKTMTACAIESCSSLEDLYRRFHSSYKCCLLPHQSIGWVITSPDTTDNASGICIVESDDISRDTLPQGLAEASQIRFSGECLVVKDGPPVSLKTESTSTMTTILAMLLARENEKRLFS